MKFNVNSNRAKNNEGNEELKDAKGWNPGSRVIVERWAGQIVDKPGRLLEKVVMPGGSNPLFVQPGEVFWEVMLTEPFKGASMMVVRQDDIRLIDIE